MEKLNDAEFSEVNELVRMVEELKSKLSFSFPDNWRFNYSRSVAMDGLLDAEGGLRCILEDHQMYVRREKHV